jgi:hypothetical protein
MTGDSECCVEFNHDENGTLIVRLQGRLVGPYAEDARIAGTQSDPAVHLVDLRK